MQTFILYAVVFLIGFVLITAIAGLIKFLLKFFFRKIRFLSCLGVALVMVLTLGLGITKKPVTQGADIAGLDTNALMQQAVKDFGGLYSAQQPVLAYKFDPKDEDVFAQDGTQTVRIKIDYLPVGSAEIEYDPEHGKFRLASPLSIPLLDTLFGGDDDSQAGAADSRDAAFSLDGIKQAAADALQGVADALQPDKSA